MGDSKVSEIHKVLKEIYRQSYYARVSSSLLFDFCIFLECEMWGGAYCGCLGTSCMSWLIALSPWENLKRIDIMNVSAWNHRCFQSRCQWSCQIQRKETTLAPKNFITEIGKKKLAFIFLWNNNYFSLFWSSYLHFCDIITKTYWCFLSFGN